MTTIPVQRLVLGEFQTNCWIYPLRPLSDDETAAQAIPSPSRDDPRPCAVIDPGAEASSIIACLRDLRLYPRYLLLTHGHFDHTGALLEVAEAFAERAPIIAIHRGDGAYLGGNALETHLEGFRALGAEGYLKARWKGMPPPGRLLEEGDRAGPFKVMHLPGHSPGSAAFYDEDAGALFCGDTLFQGTYGRTDLPGGSQADIERSLRRLASLPPGVCALPGHGETTTIAAEASWIV